MEYYSSIWMPTDFLAHHGIKGMRWGVRRWQNNDGSFNEAGKRRYFSNGSGEEYKKLAEKKSNMRSARKEYNRAFNKAYSRNYQIYSFNKAKRDRKNQQWDDAAEKAEKYKIAKKEYKNANKEYKNSEEYKAARKEKIKKAAKIGAAVAGTALVAYGTYKLNKMATDKLKAGDLYAAANKQRYGTMQLNNYLTQMEIATNYRNTSRSNGSFDPQKYRRMIETANSAASRSTAAFKEARSLLDRRDSGNYSIKDKTEAIYKMARRR